MRCKYCNNGMVRLCADKGFSAFICEECGWIWDPGKDEECSK